jgi:hypothetical protein
MKANMIATLRKLGALIVGLSVLIPSPHRLRAEAAPPATGQSPQTNTYDTDLSITHLDISLKAGFQSNSVSTVVKATLENASPNTVDNGWVKDEWKSLVPGTPHLYVGPYRVDSKQEKDFVFTTTHKMIDVVIDPDMTALQYHPEQKLRLWKAMLKVMDGYGNNEAYGKSYIYCAQGEFKKAVDPISDYLRKAVTREKVKSIDELLKKDSFLAAYVFMRGVFYLGLDDLQHAEEDVRSAFPYMLRAMVHKESVRVPSAYYEVGAIAQKDLSEYLALLELIAGREFLFENGLDEPAKKQKVEEWHQWWEKEGRQSKLDLGPLKVRCEAQRLAFREREISLAQTSETTEADVRVTIPKGDVPPGRRLPSPC